MTEKDVGNFWSINWIEADSRAECMIRKAPDVEERTLRIKAIRDVIESTFRSATESDVDRLTRLASYGMALKPFIEQHDNTAEHERMIQNFERLFIETKQEIEASGFLQRCTDEERDLIEKGLFKVPLRPT